jgi:hypothetical protein
MSIHYFMANAVKIKSTIRIEVITKETNSLYGTNMKTQFSYRNYTRWRCRFITSAVTIRVKMGEMSKVSGPTGLFTKDMWVVSQVLGLICVEFINVFNVWLNSHRWFMLCLVYISCVGAGVRR